jgi:glycosyltransferase involved in cell wall biosynthesis
MPDSKRLVKYLEQRAICHPWCISSVSSSKFSGVVVIPSLAESGNLSATIESLANNPPELLLQFLIVVVVNHRQDADLQDKADNMATLDMLPGLADRWPMNLTWVDSASPGLELPVRDGGVGLARKIGFDLALPHLAWNDADPVMVALDADTLAGPDYLPAIVRHFRRSAAGGAVIPFCHQEARTIFEQDIIDRYELFLRSYVIGLSYAGSPYAFHTVGSAMACTGNAYLRCGGMNTRRAAEDFYFLQQLKKTVGIDSVKGTVVYPSPRPSHRVPFGTGRSVSKSLADNESAIAFYRLDCYRLLKEWLSLAAGGFGVPGDTVRNEAERISPMLSSYLDRECFSETWERISRVKRTNESFLAAFNEWFDALKTMKLIHHFSADSFPRCGVEEAVPPLLEMAGLDTVVGVKAQLELLRKVQN